MKLKPLSIVPYYGGKYKMANFIADLLDYDNTDIYIEPFGGGGRVLLNKPPHQLEIYVETNAGMASLVEVLSNTETADQLIYELYETEYSKECFKKHLNILSEAEDGIVKLEMDSMKLILKDIDLELGKKKDKYEQQFNKLMQKVYNGERCIINFDEDELRKSGVGEANIEEVMRLQENINIMIKHYFEHEFTPAYLNQDGFDNAEETFCELDKLFNEYLVKSYEIDEMSDKEEESLNKLSVLFKGTSINSHLKSRTHIKKQLFTTNEEKSHKSGYEC